MVDLSEPIEFEWDKWNIDKNYQKHEITPKEAEEIFKDINVIVNEDVLHSKNEERFIAIGKTNKNNLLFIAFTIRKTKLRIISARKANKKERGLYEKIKKDS